MKKKEEAKNRRVKKIIVALLPVCLIAGMIFGGSVLGEDRGNVVSSTNEIYVPDDYAKIQWAVDNATIGDTIIVKSGIYYENVNVTKQLILRGVDTSGGKPIVDAGGSGSPFKLSADGITVEGFKTINSNSSGVYGGYAGINVISNNNSIRQHCQQQLSRYLLNVFQ